MKYLKLFAAGLITLALAVSCAGSPEQSEDSVNNFETVKEAAEAGNTREMTNLGILYLNGTGTEQDYAEALLWFEEAADEGDMKAPRYLGLIYENGWGVDSSYEKAVGYYTLAADKGDITGQYLLGQLYEKGLGVEQDYQKAYDLYIKSAARGDIICLPAMMALGNMYEQGLGVDKDTDTALEWYAKGAALGDADAMAKVAALRFPENPLLMNITAIVKVIGDGQKVAALAMEYSDTVDAASVSPADFTVEDRTVSSAYVSSEASLEAVAGEGRFVIVTLETSIDAESASMGGGPREENGEGPGGPEEDGKPGFAGPQLGQVSDKSADPVILTASIAQTGSVATAEGDSAAGSDTLMVSNITVSPDIEDFQQLVFHDDEYDRDLMYNLYVPENYDPAKSYPLVLFIHDAGVVSNNHIETLTQGLGALVWASDEEQAKHESFVLAPQYNAIMADDNSETSVDMDVTVNLIESLMDEYSIDADRLYNTGQSMGGMTSIAMDIKYPGFFAASLLVACQWDPALVAPMADMPLWIVVSEGDIKANPGQDAITEVLVSMGATLAKSTWNAEGDAGTLEQNVEDMLSENAQINYTVFEGGSHRYTWQYAYSIEGIRDWLFEQSK